MAKKQVMEFPSADQIKNDVKNNSDLDFRETVEVEDIDPEIVKEVSPKVDQFFQKLIDKDVKTSDKTNSIDFIGNTAMTSGSNELLDRQIKELMTGAGNKVIVDSLLGLRDQVDALNPHTFNWNGRGLRGMAARFTRRTFGPNVLSRYLEKYESSKVIIKDIMDGLKEGKEKLERNNTTLNGEKENMRNQIKAIKKAIVFAKLLQQKLEKEIANASDTEWADLLQQEMLFPVTQRINALEKGRVVKNQGIMSFEVIVRTNRQLINGIRNSDMTIDTLKIALTQKMAVKDARQVNDALAALNDLTGNMLVENAKELNETVVEVFKTAAQNGIDMQKITEAVQHTLSAVDNYRTFINEITPVLKDEANQIDTLNKDVEKENEKMQKGNALRSQLTKDLAEIF